MTMEMAPEPITVQISRYIHWNGYQWVSGLPYTYEWSVVDDLATFNPTAATTDAEPQSPPEP